jgi:hypothetical protein
MLFKKNSRPPITKFAPLTFGANSLKGRCLTSHLGFIISRPGTRRTELWRAGSVDVGGRVHDILRGKQYFLVPVLATLSVPTRAMDRE